MSYYICRPIGPLSFRQGISRKVTQATAAGASTSGAIPPNRPAQVFFFGRFFWGVGFSGIVDFIYSPFSMHACIHEHTRVVSLFKLAQGNCSRRAMFVCVLFFYSMCFTVLAGPQMF